MTAPAATLFSNAPPDAGGRAATLGAGAVHVWRFEPAALPPGAAALLTDEESRAAERYVDAARRDWYALQRAWVRSLLARYLGAAPRELRFVRSARGKPSLVGADGLHFNLSHASDLALLAVTSSGAVGVDVERADAELDPDALAPLALAPAERARLAGLDAAAKKRAFLRSWCRKEACLKAVGVGLLDDLTALSALADRVAIGAATVDVGNLEISAGHVAALATAAPCAPVSPVPRGRDYLTARA